MNLLELIEAYLKDKKNIAYRWEGPIEESRDHARRIILRELGFRSHSMHPNVAVWSLEEGLWE